MAIINTAPESMLDVLIEEIGDDYARCTKCLTVDSLDGDLLSTFSSLTFFTEHCYNCGAHRSTRLKDL